MGNWCMGSHWRVGSCTVTLSDLYFGKFTPTSLWGKIPNVGKMWQGNQLGNCGET